MSIWDKYPNYSNEELRTLTAVAAETLIDKAEDAGIDADVLRLSSRSAAVQLQSLLQDRVPGIQSDQLQSALDDPDQARKMALAVLEEIRGNTPLAELVAEAYEARNREMFGGETLLLAGAIVILAIRIKSLDITRQGARVTFDKAGEAVKTFVAGLVNSSNSGA